MMSHARYIGDGVYAQFDGNMVHITTGSHLLTECEDHIVMEPQVLRDFQRYVEDLKKQLEYDPVGTPKEI